ncbi:MAG: adenosine kinase [Bacteroidales bacterium]|nr:adenosine kinase [Bacteroidales bacterium]
MKVACIGNALVDKVCLLENDAILTEENLPKGSMQLINSEESKRLQQKLVNLQSQIATGGSAANTASGIANMGVHTSYIGMVGNDELGRFYEQDMQDNNISTHIFRNNEMATGLALALVSPDGERTFATHLGAAVTLSAENITSDLFSDFDYLHIEGYLISNNDLFNKILECVKQANCKISIDLASYNVVEENLEYLRTVCKGVHIIFANEDEARAFSGKQVPEEALEFISQYSDIAVVKIGAKGSLISHEGTVYRISETQRNKIDTTGAGDLYAGGFLAALCGGKDFNQCGKWGSILAGNVIEIMGTKMDSERWNAIKKEIEAC